MTTRTPKWWTGITESWKATLAVVLWIKIGRFPAWPWIHRINKLFGIRDSADTMPFDFRIGNSFPFSAASSNFFSCNARVLKRTQLLLPTLNRRKMITLTVAWVRNLRERGRASVAREDGRRRALRVGPRNRAEDTGIPRWNVSMVYVWNHVFSVLL